VTQAVNKQGKKMLNTEKRIYRHISEAYSNGEKSETGFARYYESGHT
jgi:hypothetical protein